MSSQLCAQPAWCFRVKVAPADWPPGRRVPPLPPAPCAPASPPAAPLGREFPAGPVDSQVLGRRCAGSGAAWLCPKLSIFSSSVPPVPPGSVFSSLWYVLHVHRTCSTSALPAALRLPQPAPETRGHCAHGPGHGGRLRPKFSFLSQMMFPVSCNCPHQPHFLSLISPLISDALLSLLKLSCCPFLSSLTPRSP